ncbi:MAG: hypothetical protein OXU53_08955 [Deltaproteobacteria bacterium]|nr:hypothetical protein [Deltaproteobacteria bacterium]
MRMLLFVLALALAGAALWLWLGAGEIGPRGGERAAPVAEEPGPFHEEIDDADKEALRELLRDSQ